MTRPRALVLTPRMPWPLDDGGRIVLWQAICAVAAAYDTTLVSLVPATQVTGPPPAALIALGVRVVRVAHHPPWTPLALLRGALGRWPYTLARYRNTMLDATLRRLVIEEEPAFAYVNHLHLATYLDALGETPVVLREHNLEQRWLQRYAESRRNPLTRAYARAQARRMRRTESELCSRCDLVLAIQEDEAEVLRRIAPEVRVEVVPIGIEMAAERVRAPECPPIVLLLGSWDWPPNREGALRFLDRGWARVRARAPEARLRVVGKALPPALAAAARRAGAEPVGHVEDVAPEFARSSVMVVPLWMGAGARVKIVEALAARLPVVTTTLGAEGLGLTPGVHACFADTPEALGETVAELLEQPARASAMAEAGQHFARERFSLEQVSRRTRELCESIALQPRNTRS